MAMVEPYCNWPRQPNMLRSFCYPRATSGQECFSCRAHRARLHVRGQWRRWRACITCCRAPATSGAASSNYLDSMDRSRPMRCGYRPFRMALDVSSIRGPDVGLGHLRKYSLASVDPAGDPAGTTGTSFVGRLDVLAGTQSARDDRRRGGG